MDVHDVSPHPPTQPPRAAAQPPRISGRCFDCGYSLTGLPREGTCPECGSPYTDESARRLQPWPSALAICLRLGWPLVGLLVAGSMSLSGDPAIVAQGIVLTWFMLGAIAFNSYFQVRSMLKRSLPNKTRTRGPVAILRAIGTTVCVIIFLSFIAVPVVLVVGCFVLFSELG